jgi:hypothetical protein
MSLGQRVTQELNQFISQNLFWIVILVAFGLLLGDIYDRFFKIKRNENIDLVERGLWLKYLKRQRWPK